MIPALVTVLYLIIPRPSWKEEYNKKKYQNVYLFLSFAWKLFELKTFSTSRVTNFSQFSIAGDTREIARVAIYDSRDYNKYFLSMDLYTRCSIVPPFSALGLGGAVF